jgi:hypothetical protein
VNRKRGKTWSEKGQTIKQPGKTMKETISRDSRPKRQEQIIVQKGSSDVLLFSMEDGSYYALNEVGNRIWELCDGTHGVSQLISILATEYDAPAKIIEMDVMEVLEELQSKNLLVECGEDHKGFEDSGVSQGSP